MAAERARVTRFYLHRDEDLTGTSGEGIVAYGAVLPSGKAIIEWVTHLTSVAIYDSLVVLEQIHGHEGRTKIIPID
jgi:hypothetical protein